MAQSPLLRIPAKVTEEVDMAAAVGSLIHNSYGQDPKGFKDQLQTLNRARQDAVRGAGSDATARDLLYKWFHMLEMLELRFPELRVPFPWKDAFTSKPISQHSLAYEKASIIFNIASILSSLGAKTNRLTSGITSPTSKPTNAASLPTTADTIIAASGTKLAYASMRQAAGMLSYINDNFLHAPSSDMSKDVVRWLVDVQLAQATEVFWERTLEEKKGGSLVARIAAQITLMYTSLTEEAKEWITRGIFEKSWGALVQTKAKYFASVAQYYRALVDDAATSHGSCLVRLTLSESLAKEAQKACLAFAGINTAPSKESGPSSSTLPPDAASSMKAIIDTHLAIVTARQGMAVKDNDLIYHDILPTESTLPSIEPLSTAKPISIQDIYSSPEVQKLIGANAAGAPSNDLFSSLVPLGVHEAASMYSEEKAKLVRSEGERVALTDGQLQAALEYMTLPSGLKRFKIDALQDLSDPGAEVRGWAEEEIEGGGSRGQDGLGTGSNAIDEGLRSVESIRERARGELEESSKVLDEEAAMCEKLRVRHGDRWAQSPSGLETKALRSDIKRNREALSSATENDNAIRRLWEESEPLIRILLGGKESLDRAFAETIASSSYRNGSAPQLVDLLEDDSGGVDQKEVLRSKVASIESQLSMLQRIKKERTDTLTELRSRVQSDDISHLLILNRRASADSQTQLFQQELDKFRGLTQRILRNISDQEKVLADLALSWKEITESTQGRSIDQEWEKKNRSREQLIAQLRRAKDANAQVRAGLGKALAFYSELQEIATTLRRNARSFAEERTVERERLVKELEWEAKGAADLGGAFSKMSMAPSGEAYRVPPSLHSPPPPPPMQQSPTMSSYSHASPYGNLDAAFGSASPASRGPPPPPAPTSHTYSAPPAPPMSPSSYAPPTPSHYAKPPPPPFNGYTRQPSLPLDQYSQGHTYGVPPPPSHYQQPPPPPQQQQQQYQQQSAPYLPPPPPQFQSQYGGRAPYPGPPPPPPTPGQAASPYAPPPPPSQRWQPPY